jgi:hypothetical protein
MVILVFIIVQRMILSSFILQYSHLPNFKSQQPRDKLKKLRQQFLKSLNMEFIMLKLLQKMNILIWCLLLVKMIIIHIIV